MPNKGKFIGSQDNLFVPDAPTIGAATAGDAQVSVAFTAPSDVGGDAVTLYGVSAFLAGATINYKVSVGTGTLSTGGSGNVYFIDGIPTKTLSLIKGFTYVFDLSDSSNSGHPFAFKDGSGSSYTSGVTTSGTAGNASATVTLVLATDASEPSSYYCTSHGNGMGNTISLIEASASTDPLGAAQAGATGSSSPVTVTGLTNGTSYIAQAWAINDYGNGPLSAATASFSPVQPVGFFSGGESSGGSRVNSIDKIVITTTGNATDFGNLSTTMAGGSAIGGSTRYIVGGGYQGSYYLTTITFKLFSSSGNMSSFGSLTGTSSYWGMGLGNSTRGFIAGGLNGGSGNRVIHYITIASEGNSADFGDLTQDNSSGGGLASSTRGVIGGGSSANNVIQYITIASLGNASDFGDLTSSRNSGVGAVSSGTRGVFAGGASEDIIDYITIASTGNATDFGDLSTQRTYVAGASSTIRGVFGSGVNQSGSSGRTNIMEYITIASTGNVTDFGDLSVVREAASGASNSHGGLS
jgi:hypothetical protein